MRRVSKIEVQITIHHLDVVNIEKMSLFKSPKFCLFWFKSSDTILSEVVIFIVSNMFSNGRNINCNILERGKYLRLRFKALSIILMCLTLKKMSLFKSAKFFLFWLESSNTILSEVVFFYSFKGIFECIKFKSP